MGCEKRRNNNRRAIITKRTTSKVGDESVIMKTEREVREEVCGDIVKTVKNNIDDDVVKLRTIQNKTADNKRYCRTTKKRHKTNKNLIEL